MSGKETCVIQEVAALNQRIYGMSRAAYRGQDIYPIVSMAYPDAKPDKHYGKEVERTHFDRT